MNKSAREMFEELGYEFEPHHYSMIALIVYRKDLEYIYFDADEKIDIRGFVDMKLLQAINQQCKELGWLDEQRKILTIDNLPMHKDTYFFGYGIDIDKPYEMANQIVKLRKENQELRIQAISREAVANEYKEVIDKIRKIIYEIDELRNTTGGYPSNCIDDLLSILKEVE